jgi:hypothetical protein
MCTVASAPAAFRVRVWQITSWRRGPRGGRPPPEGASVAFYEAAGRVNSCCDFSPGFEICSVHGRLMAVGPISRGSVSLLFALIKGELMGPVGARGDSKGGGAIYAAAMEQQPSNTSRSPTHRTCERSGPASFGRRRRGHMATRAAGMGRGCRTRWGSNRSLGWLRGPQPRASNLSAGVSVRGHCLNPCFSHDHVFASSITWFLPSCPVGTRRD